MASASTTHVGHQSGSWGPGPSGVFHLPFPSPVLSCESFYSAYFVLEMSLLERMQTGLFVLKLVNCWRKKNIRGWSLRWPQCLGLGWEVGVQEVLHRLTHRSRTMWNDNDTFIGVSGDMREGEGHRARGWPAGWGSPAVVQGPPPPLPPPMGPFRQLSRINST